MTSKIYNLKDLQNSLGPNLYARGKELIPGGTQLLSKRPEMFAPEVWPSYFSKAKGINVWDLENRQFSDFSVMGIGASILGYADDDVDSAVTDCISKGVASSLNCPEEVELAEELIALHPWFDMVRYAKSGGEAVAISIRIARAHTSRDIILFSGYHGWSDWYLAANLADNNNLDGQLMPGLSPAGVPRGLKGSAIPFNANDYEDLKLKIKGKESKIAAIIIEPARGKEPNPEYLKKLKGISEEIGCVLIFDEITSGFRVCPGGIHRKYGINPDIAVFAKSLANGYPMAALIGVQKVMESAQSTFISSTNWTDRIGPVAALATIKKYNRLNVDKHIIAIGEACQSIWSKHAQENNLDITISGLPTLSAFNFNSNHASQLMTRFTTEMLQRGFLAWRQFKPSYAHKDLDLKLYESAISEVFKEMSSIDPDNILQTPQAHSGFTRLTKE
ncbi:aminotransferase class III-fold pyridoxal phosphate-dependent enzyme [Gammaproteobacteria bacterium]|nr:aminotransferase class III-fold pyridoxal phosphate-dependent enzyme [Gammaproteobacteria bacterium]